MDVSEVQNDMRVSPTRIIYFGTPDYAVPSLRALHADSRYEICLVVTQPDRPAGRKHRLTAPPVKIAAQELGLQVCQPESLRAPESRQPLIDASADVFVVAAYGLIFGRKMLAIPSLGCVNLHASLLPKYRGPSPVAAAILAGDRESGVTLMQMEPGIDTGAILDNVSVEIQAIDTTLSLTQKLGDAGAALLVSRLHRFVDGGLSPIPQPETGASLTRMLTKEDGRIDWRGSADAIERQVRAMWNWPRAWTTASDDVVQIHAASVGDLEDQHLPGQVLRKLNTAAVACGTRALVLETVQPAGGKAMPGIAWISGLRGELPRLGSIHPQPQAAPLLIDV
jgi:methionyl-tRNA formyltransferase